MADLLTQPSWKVEVAQTPHKERRSALNLEQVDLLAAFELDLRRQLQRKLESRLQRLRQSGPRIHFAAKRVQRFMRLVIAKCRVRRLRYKVQISSKMALKASVSPSPLPTA